MKICAIICEYNPFHNGHLYQLREAKRLSGADVLLCVMSGNFVQRGEAAVMNKYIRAKHAVNAGADVVIELPTPFATSSAELFAKGAISILRAIPSVDTLCFGAENADKELFLKAAGLMNDEPSEVSARIKQGVDGGLSYAKARAEAWKELLPDGFLSSPNNILGVEYTRAILASDAKIEILPIKRVGGGYKDETLHAEYSSASAIRRSIGEGGSAENAIPDFVLGDLPKQLENKLDALEKYAILSSSPEELAQIVDCTEGLENAFLKAAEKDETLVSALTSARYTSSRIRRIALQCLLKINEALVRESLIVPLYLKVLGIKKERSDLLSELSKSSLPVLARPRDESLLSGVAKRCYERDLFAEKIYALLYGAPKEINIFIE